MNGFELILPFLRPNSGNPRGRPSPLEPRGETHVTWQSPPCVCAALTCSSEKGKIL